MKKLIALSLVCLLFAGCTPSAVDLLEAIVAAAEIVVPIIPGTDPATAAQINTYLSASMTIVDDLLGTSPITTAAIDKAIGDFETLAVPQLPAGPASVLVAGVAKAIQVFVDDYKGATVSTATTAQFGNAAFPLGKRIKIDAKTKSQMQAVRSRAEAVKKSLKK